MMEKSTIHIKGYINTDQDESTNKPWQGGREWAGGMVLQGLAWGGVSFRCLELKVLVLTVC